MPWNLPERLRSGDVREVIITDNNGYPWVRVAGLDDRTILFDVVTGEPIVVIERRPWSSNFQKFWYRIFAWMPNRPYQDSTEEFTMSDDDGATTRAPLYLFAKVFEDTIDEEAPKRCCSDPDSIVWYKGNDKKPRPHCSCSYSRYNGNEGGPEVWTVDASGLDGEAPAVEIQPVDDQRKCVALIDQSSFRTNEEGELTCGILCAPGVNPLSCASSGTGSTRYTVISYTGIAGYLC